MLSHFYDVAATGWIGLVSYFIRLPPVGSGTKLVWIWIDYIPLSFLPSSSLPYYLIAYQYPSFLILTLFLPSVSLFLFCSFPLSSPAPVCFTSAVRMSSRVSELLYLCANVSVVSEG